MTRLANNKNQRIMAQDRESIRLSYFIALSIYTLLAAMVVYDVLLMLDNPQVIGMGQFGWAYESLERYQARGIVSFGWLGLGILFSLYGMVKGKRTKFLAVHACLTAVYLIMQAASVFMGGYTQSPKQEQP